MTRQVAIGAIVGFALAVLALSLWPRPGSPDPGPTDAGAPEALPKLETRTIVPQPSAFLRHRELYEVVPRDGGR